jgi:thioesterase domain-containing protein/acyl carrier protein
VWRDILGIADVPVDENFFTIGGSSVLAMEAVSRLERELGIEIPLQAFFEAPTVEGIVARIGKSYSPDDPIVVWLRRGTAEEPPLFCLFGVHLYQDLAFAMPGERAVVGMHVPFRYVPGTDPRPPLQAVARRYVELIRRHQAHGPYCLLGLCFGGIVAYEVARMLEADGELVEAVAVLDALLPTAVQVDRVARLLGYAERAWKGGSGEALRVLKKVGVTVLERSRLPGTLRALTSRLTALQRPQPIDLPVDGPEVEAEVERFASHASKLEANLLVVRATGESPPPWLDIASDQGWGDRAERVFVHDIPATHIGILREPHVRSLAEAVAAAMGSAHAGKRSSVLSSSMGSIRKSSPSGLPTTNPKC